MHRSKFGNATRVKMIIMKMTSAETAISLVSYNDYYLISIGIVASISNLVCSSSIPVNYLVNRVHCLSAGTYLYKNVNGTNSWN